MLGSIVLGAGAMFGSACGEYKSRPRDAAAPDGPAEEDATIAPDLGGGDHSGDDASVAPPAAMAMIGPEGGEMAVTGARISFPEGALASATMIAVEVASAPESAAALSRFYRFEPEGLALAAPVTVRFDLLEGTPESAVVFWSRPDGSYERLPTTAEGLTLVAQSTHFSIAFAGPTTAVYRSCSDGPLEDCTCELPPPDGSRLCLEQPVKVREGACECKQADLTVLCPADMPYPCFQAYKGKKEGEPCDGKDSLGMSGSGTTTACTSDEWECRKWTFKSVDKVPCMDREAPEKPMTLWLMRTNLEEPVDLPPVTNAAKRLIGADEARAACPTKAASRIPCWESLNKMNCRVGRNEYSVSCGSDSECNEGDVCDINSACKCCVASPPAPLVRGTPLERVLSSGCEPGTTRCALPDHRHDCRRDDSDPRLAFCAFKDDLVWAFREGTLPTGNIDEMLHAAGVLKRNDARCLWKFSFALETDLSEPLSAYKIAYECGGVNVTGRSAYRVKPTKGVRHETRVVHDGCATP
jgi:hypothetical protein